jgi:hypothetical protein
MGNLAHDAVEAGRRMALQTGQGPLAEVKVCNTSAGVLQVVSTQPGVGPPVEGF